MPSVGPTSVARGERVEYWKKHLEKKKRFKKAGGICAEKGKEDKRKGGKNRQARRSRKSKKKKTRGQDDGMTN